MKKIDLINVEFFHFTFLSNLNSIEKKGLISQFGEHSRGVEKKPRVFFSKGTDNLLKCIDVWIRYLYVMKYKIEHVQKPLSEFDYNKSIENGIMYCELEKKLIHELQENVASNRFLTDDIKKSVFEKLRNDFNNRVYLSLNLDEEDFDFEDVDDIKEYFFNADNITKNYIGYMYGDLEYPSSKMEPWNMHTKTNKCIPPEKISLVSKNNETNALSIILALYKEKLKTNKSIKEKLPDLSEWIEYIENISFNENF